MSTWWPVLFTFLAHGPLAQEPCQPKPILIKAGKLWDGEKIRTSVDLFLADGQVRGLASRGTLDLPAGTRIIDAATDTVLPGLIDAHAHLFELGGPMTGEDFPNPFANQFPHTTQLLLRAGVTTIRVHLFDLEQGPRLRRLAQKPCYPSPRMDIAGPGFIGGAPQLARTQVWGAEDPADVRQKVRRIHQAGAQWVTIHNGHRFPAEVVQALVAEARRLGLSILAAGNTQDEIRTMLALGVDSIEYLDRSEAAAYAADLIAQLKEMADPPTFVAPIGYYHRVRSLAADPAAIELGMLGQRLSESHKNRLLTDLRALYQDADSQLAYIVKPLLTFDEKFLQLYRAGVPMAVGTDCGSPGNFHSDAIWWEINSWRSLGVPLEEVLTAATVNAAKLLGKNDLGQLQVGYQADVLIYRGDFFDGQVAKPERIRTVIKSGVAFVEEGKWQGDHP